nr:MAG TPA: hypothetical protein [Caudoviricetes sp.]
MTIMRPLYSKGTAMDTNDNTVETDDKIVEFKFNKDAIVPAIKRNSKKLIAGAAVLAAGAALTLMAVRSVPEIEEPEELEHDDLDEADAVESEDSDD